MSKKDWDKEEANKRWRAKKHGEIYRKTLHKERKSRIKTLTPEQKEVISEGLNWLLFFRQNERNERKRLAGEYPDFWTTEFKNKLKARDKHTCFMCGVTDKPSRLHLHHINYFKYDCDPYNLITLCSSCHPKTNHRRDKWHELFYRNSRIIRLIELHAPLIILRNEYRILIGLFKRLGLCPPKDNRIKEVKVKYNQLYS